MASRRKKGRQKVAQPETVGWQKLMTWLGREGNTMSSLALVVRVSQPSAHAWRHRHKRPTGDNLLAVCRLTGATPEDWKQPVSSRDGEAA